MRRDLINRITDFRERVIASRDTALGRDRDGLAIIKAGLGYHYTNESAAASRSVQAADVDIDAITAKVSAAVSNDVTEKMSAILDAIKGIKVPVQTQIASSGEAGIINDIDLDMGGTFISSRQLDSNFSEIGKKKTGAIEENELDDLFNLMK